MCVLCESDAEEDALVARRQHVLQVFALLEHPDSLPTAGALRLRREIRALTRLHPSRVSCEATPPPEEGVASAP